MPRHPPGDCAISSRIAADCPATATAAGSELAADCSAICVADDDRLPRWSARGSANGYRRRYR